MASSPSNRHSSDRDALGRAQVHHLRPVITLVYNVLGHARLPGLKVLARKLWSGERSLQDWLAGCRSMPHMKASGG